MMRKSNKPKGQVMTLKPRAKMQVSSIRLEEKLWDRLRNHAQRESARTNLDVSVAQLLKRYLREGLERDGATA